MARSLADVKVGDTLVSPLHHRGDMLRLEDYVVVKIGRQYLYALRRYSYDHAIERGDNPAESRNVTKVSIMGGHYRHRNGVGSGRDFYTPAQWEAREVAAAARQRFSTALQPLTGSGIDRVNLNWGAGLADVPDEAIVELLDDLTATIEAHRRRWGVTDG